MERNKLLAFAVAAAFALPFAGQASAAGDTLILAQGGGPSGASATGTGPTGGTPSPQSAGEPKAPTDRAGDLRRCDNMTGVERENCLRDSPRAGTTGSSSYGSTGSSAGTAGATGGSTTSPSVVSPSGSGTTGATAGPGSAGNATAPGSATATSPDTSGTGKPK